MHGYIQPLHWVPTLQIDQIMNQLKCIKYKMNEIILSAVLHHIIYINGDMSPHFLGSKPGVGLKYVKT